MDEEAKKVLQLILDELRQLNEKGGTGGTGGRASEGRVETAAELRRRGKDLARITEEFQEQERISQALITNLRVINQQEENGLVQSQRANEILRERGELHQKELRFYEQIIILGEELDDQQKQRYEDLIKTKKLADNMPDLVSALFGGSGGAEKLTSMFSNIGNKLETNLKEKLRDTISSEFPDFINALRGGDIRAAAASFSSIIAVAGTLALAAFSAAIIKLSLDLANAEAAFMKTTSASKDMARSLTIVYDEARYVGASIEEVSQSMSALYTGFHDFTFL